MSGKMMTDEELDEAKQLLEAARLAATTVGPDMAEIDAAIVWDSITGKPALRIYNYDDKRCKPIEEYAMKAPKWLAKALALVEQMHNELADKVEDDDRLRRIRDKAHAAGKAEGVVEGRKGMREDAVALCHKEIEEWVGFIDHIPKVCGNLSEKIAALPDQPQVKEGT